MKAHATLKNFDSEQCKKVIVRNLNRILDIRIIDCDIDNGMLHFLYHGQRAFEKVSNELRRIGHPILDYTADRDDAANATDTKTYGRLSIFSGRARRPYTAVNR